MNYEYRVLLSSEPPAALQEKLNALGAEGFRLIAVTERCDAEGTSTGDTVYLMREVSGNP